MTSTEYRNRKVSFFFGFLCYIITVASLQISELKCVTVGTLVEGPTLTTASHLRVDKQNMGWAEIFLYPQSQAL